MAEACILVVEDEPLVRELIAGELREVGYTVIEASSGADAVAMIASRPEIDLLFTDIVLGGTPDGWDVALAFRAIAPDRPVIYASAFVPGEMRRVPASVFFDKPYLPSQIVHAVRLLLPSRASTAAPALPAAPPGQAGLSAEADPGEDPLQA